MSEVRNNLKWADGKVIKSEIEIQVLSLLGPKTDEDLAPPPKVEKVAKPKVAKPTLGTKENLGNIPVFFFVTIKRFYIILRSPENDSDSASTITDLMKKVQFHKPGENFKTDGYVITDKTMELLKEHLKITGGQVIGN